MSGFVSTLATGRTTLRFPGIMAPHLTASGPKMEPPAGLIERVAKGETLPGKEARVGTRVTSSFDGQESEPTGHNATKN